MGEIGEPTRTEPLQVPAPPVEEPRREPSPTPPPERTPERTPEEVPLPA